MNHITKSRDLSARRACRLIGQPWSTQQYKPDPELTAKRRKRRERVADLAQKHEAAGYRTVHAAMVTAGETVNHKTVLRIWQEDGYARRVKPVKRKVPGAINPAWPLAIPAAKNDIWALDFVHDSTEDNRPFRILSVLDLYTRQCVTLSPARSIGHLRLIDELTLAIRTLGKPKAMRMDNGPEFIATGFTDWLELMGIEDQFIAPGSPWQNGHIESFNGTLRHGLLNRVMFTDLAHARASCSQFQSYYNADRPHSSLGGLTPDDYARTIVSPESPTALQASAA